MAADPKPEPAPARANPSPGTNLVESLWNAAVNAFVVVLLGKIAFSLVSGIAARMIPGAPPGFSGPVALPVTPVAWWNALTSHRFQILFAVVFLVCLRGELSKRSPKNDSQNRTSRWHRIGRRFSENWFGSLIGNAFLAMVLAMVLAKLPSFSAWQWFWHWLIGWLHPERMLGDGAARWFDWYGHNQIKFNFWFLYIAAVSDDFGIPNFKSLARWLWRRWTKPKTITPDQRPATNQSGEA